MAQRRQIQSNHEVAGLIPGLAQRVTDLALLCLWHRPAAIAVIGSLAWEPSYAAGAAPKSKKKKKKKERKKKKKKKRKERKPLIH